MSQQWVQCPYDPNHRVIAQRLPFHELKCRNNFRVRNAVIENTQTLVESLEAKNGIFNGSTSDPQSCDAQSVSSDVKSFDKWPSSVSQQSFGERSITSASFQSFDKDSLRWEKKKIEKNRVTRGLDIQPRSSSPEYETYIALCDAIEEKDATEESDNASQYLGSISRGRGLPNRSEWKAAPPPGNSLSTPPSVHHQRRGTGSCLNNFVANQSRSSQIPVSKHMNESSDLCVLNDKDSLILNEHKSQASNEPQTTKNDSSQRVSEVAMRSLLLMQSMKVSPKS